MNTKKVLPVVVVLILVAVAIFAWGLPDRDNQRSNTTTEISAKVERSNPRTVCDFFINAVFHQPGAAYDLMTEDFKSQSSRKQFRKSISVILPPADKIISIDFIKSEKGFTEMGLDGKKKGTSSSYSYRVKSKDDFQPECVVGVDVTRQGDAYAVLRYSVQTGSTP